MKKIVICLAVLFFPFMAAQGYDSRSSFADTQYSPNGVNNPYSQYGSQYSPNSIDNPRNQFNSPYSPNSIDNPYGKYELEHSAKVLDDPFVKKAKAFEAGLPSTAEKKKAVEKAKATAKAEDAMVASFFQPKKAIPVFFYLLVFSCLAGGLTIFIVISVFKK
jgi:hypothetical protein